MLEEPSSGSNKTKYSPSSLQATGKSSSSLAMPLTMLILANWSLMMSLEITSNFFCVSPCTFSSPAQPRTPANAPCCNLLEISTQEVIKPLRMAVISLGVLRACRKEGKDCMSSSRK